MVDPEVASFYSSVRLASRLRLTSLTVEDSLWTTSSRWDSYAAFDGLRMDPSTPDCFLGIVTGGVAPGAVKSD